MKKLLTSLLIWLFIPSSILAADFDALVSKDRQAQLGLDTLTPFQKQSVARLMLESYMLGKTPSTTEAVIESRIDGDFEGWEGETVFKLQNGQIWIQEDYSYEYHYAYSPKVIIYKSGAKYKMKVDGVDEIISVKRLK